MAKEITVEDFRKHYLMLQNIRSGATERFNLTPMEIEAIDFTIAFLRANIEEIEESQ